MIDLLITWVQLNPLKVAMLNKGLDLLGHQELHSLLAFVLSFLPTFLILTILYVPYYRVLDSLHLKGTWVAGCITAIFLMSLLFFSGAAAFYSHWGLDYFSTWYYAPLAPHIGG